MPLDQQVVGALAQFHQRTLDDVDEPPGEFAEGRAVGWARAEKWLGYRFVSIIDVSPITAKRLIWFVRVTLLLGLVYTSIWLAPLIVSVTADPRGLTLANLSFCETMKSGPAMIAKDGQEIASFESAKLVSQPGSGNTTLNFEGGIDGIQFLLEAVDSESARDAGEGFFPKQLLGEDEGNLGS